MDSWKWLDRALRNILLVLVLSSYSILVSQCGALRTPPTMPSAWQQRWLRGEPCAAPCWEGITPGQTTMPDAVALLNANPLIQSVSVMPVTFPDLVDRGEVHWRWRDGTAGGTFYYQLPPANQTVTKIAPLFYRTFPLQDIIAAYGEPTHVIATAHIQEPFERNTGQTTYGLTLIYMNHGLRIRAAQAQPFDKPTLEPTMLLDSPYLFPTGPEGFARSFKLSTPAELVPWQGYQSFAFYCRDYRGGLACQSAPVSTLVVWVGVGVGSLLLLAFGRWIWRKRADKPRKPASA